MLAFSVLAAHVPALVELLLLFLLSRYGGGREGVAGQGPSGTGTA